MQCGSLMIGEGGEFDVGAGGRSEDAESDSLVSTSSSFHGARPVPVHGARPVPVGGVREPCGSSSAMASSWGGDVAGVCGASVLTWNVARVAFEYLKKS